MTGNNDLVIRGGSGLYYATPYSTITAGPTLGNQFKANTFVNDGLPGFLLNPTRNFTQEQIVAGASPQSPRALAWGYKTPFSWQSKIGFQKELGSLMGFGANLTFLRDYNQERGRDPNLFFDPVTGYNLNPATASRPDPRWGEINWVESTGRAQALLLATSFTRRFHQNFESSLTTVVKNEQRNTISSKWSKKRP